MITNRRTIIITGGSGFIGSHLIDRLVKNQEDIIAFIRPSSDLWRIRQFIPSIEITHDMSELQSSIQRRNSKSIIVVHLATEFGYNKSYEEIFDSNITFPNELIKTISASKEHFTFINTDTFFNSDISHTRLPGYSYTKKHFLNELSYKKCKVINMRLEHVYGPRDNKNKFLQFFLDKILNNEKEINLTSGLQTRDFIYISDVVSAYCKVIDKIDQIEEYEEFSVGTGFSTSLRSLLEMLIHIVNSNSILNFGVIELEGEIMASLGNPKALHDIGWYPIYSLEEGLKEFVRETKSNDLLHVK